VSDQAKIPGGADTPPNPSFVALFDQINSDLNTMVRDTMKNLDDGWNRVTLVDHLAGLYHDLLQDSGHDLAVACLLATAVVRLAQESH